MRFHIDFGAFVSTLPVMLYGMIGGLFVMAVICLLLVGLYKVGSLSGKKKEER